MTESTINAEEHESCQRSYGNCQPPAGIENDAAGLAENKLIRGCDFRRGCLQRAAEIAERGHDDGRENCAGDNPAAGGSKMKAVHQPSQQQAAE